jgi:hypothetical protein
MFIRTADVTAHLTFPEGTEGANEKMVMPGDNVEMVCTLTHDTPLEVGSRFSLREGGKTIGTGLVSEIMTISDGKVRSRTLSSSLRWFFVDRACLIGVPFSRL